MWNKTVKHVCLLLHNLTRASRDQRGTGGVAIEAGHHPTFIQSSPSIIQSIHTTHPHTRPYSTLFDIMYATVLVITALLFLGSSYAQVQIRCVDYPDPTPTWGPHHIYTYDNATSVPCPSVPVPLSCNLSTSQHPDTDVTFVDPSENSCDDIQASTWYSIPQLSGPSEVVFTLYEQNSSYGCVPSSAGVFCNASAVN